MKTQKFFINVVSNIIIVAIVAMLYVGSVGNSGAITAAGGGSEVIYRGNPNLPKVSLMFNVYMGDEFIDGILDVLEKNKVKATFFVGGSYVARHINTVKKISAKGHEIANHGYNHKDHKSISLERNIEEIKMCFNQLESIRVPQKMLFAPPSGSIGQDMLKAAKQLGYKVIMWSKDTIDWRDKDADLIYKRATMDIQNGYFILMHPTENTLKALPRICQTLISKDFSLTTVTDNLSLDSL